MIYAPIGFSLCSLFLPNNLPSAPLMDRPTVMYYTSQTQMQNSVAAPSVCTSV